MNKQPKGLMINDSIFVSILLYFTVQNSSIFNMASNPLLPLVHDFLITSGFKKTAKSLQKESKQVQPCNKKYIRFFYSSISSFDFLFKWVEETTNQCY